MNKNNIKDLEVRLLEAKKAYYIDDEPIMSDDDYDLLEDELRVLDPDNRILKMTGSDIKNKNNWSISKLTEVMGSLDKVKDFKEFEKWYWDLVKGQKYNGNLYYNPKGDGGSIQCTYQNGKLVQAVTRGNGYEGEDITKNFLKMKNTVATIPEKSEVVIKGEMLITHKDFADLNKLKSYANPRNAASGIAKNIDGTYCEFITVLYYGLSINGKNIVMSKLQDEINKFKLRHIGIYFIKSLSYLKDVYDKVTKDRNIYGFDIDGLVIKTDSDPIMKGNKPINYMALKFPADKGIGVIESIRFQRSRTGRIVPVAQLKKSIYLSGANITNISLGSWDLMHSKQIYPGSVVEVIRSNDVIPYINKSLNNDNAKKLTIADVKKIANDNTITQIGAHLFSSVKDESTLIYDIQNIIDVLGYKNISGSTIKSIVNHFKLKEAYEFFDIDPDKLINADGFGQGKIDIIKQQFRDKNKLDIKMFIKCLNISDLGSSRIAEICNTYNIEDLPGILKITQADLMKVPGISSTSAIKYHDGLKLKRIFAHELAKRLVIEKQSSMIKSNVLNGLKFCITGKTSLSRKDFERLIAENGGMNVSINKADYLITNDGDSGSAKNKKAELLGIKIISEKDFQNKFNIK